MSFEVESNPKRKIQTNLHREERFAGANFFELSVKSYAKFNYLKSLKNDWK